MSGNKKKIVKITLGILAGYVLIMLIGYMGVIFYFSSHFQKGTIINGIDCGNKTVEQVKKELQKQVSDYKLKIEEIDGKTETISAVQIELTYVDDKKVDALLEAQDSWSWMSGISEKDTYEVELNTSYKEELLGEVLEELSCFQEENIIEPQNAHLQRQEDQYVIIPEVEGTKLNREKMEREVKKAIENGTEEIDLEELGCYEKPQVYQDDERLQKDLKEKNEMLRMKELAGESGIESF